MHNDSNGIIVRRIRAEMQKAWLVFEGTRGEVIRGKVRKGNTIPRIHVAHPFEGRNRVV
jgi:hypothetical protein